MTYRLEHGRPPAAPDGRPRVPSSPWGTTKRPNFLIVGAAKSGTTSLYNYLKQHPQVYMSPRKHTRFFSFRGQDPDFRGPRLKGESVPYAISDAASYHALFAGATDEVAIGEASHSYLYKPEAPGRIKEYDPDMKIIALLRNPAERAYSHYRQMIRDGREPLGDFTRALEEEGARIRGNWWPDFHYVQIGLYHAQLKRYFDLFERHRIRVYLYEDFDTDPHGTLVDIFRFLSVDDRFVPEANVRYNASGVPRNKTLHSVLQGLRRVRPSVERLLPAGQSRRLLRIGGALHNRNLTKPQLSQEMRREASDRYFREDIVKLQGLIRRDLSAWLG